MVFLAALSLLWAILIVIRLVQLQVVSHEAYREQAERQQHRVVQVKPTRGAIFDRLGRPLAMSLPADTVCVNPKRVPDIAVAADILSGVLGIDRQELYTRIKTAADNKRGFLPISKRIDPALSERLRSLKLDWIEFRTESERYYPNGPLAAHVIGAVDFQEKGNLGLEQSLNKELRGRTGIITTLTDVRQRGIESEVSKPVEAGTNLTLTLDEGIQFAAERELKAAAEQYHATAGSVVVMNPHTGDILALASYPGFDPNEPPKPGENPSLRFDQPVSLPFEPGSVFKIVTLSAALETTNLRPSSLIQCGSGTFNLFGRIIHEAKHGYGTLSMADVLAKSSNIGAIQIGLRVGNENLLRYIRRFGFGAKTGLPLPAEASGTVRDLKYWRKTSIGSVAMGHEISTTAVQLARACSVIANGGLLLKPRLILAKQKPGGPQEMMPIETPQRILKPENAITMRQMMEGVVLHGTGRAAKLKGYSSGGKTGSAQIFDLTTKHYTHEYNGSYVGFAPVTNPALVIAVTLNGVKVFGGVVAAPVFRAVATEALRLLDVPKDLPEDIPEPDNQPVDENDLSIADLGEPPSDLLAAAVAPQPAVPVVSVAMPAQNVAPVSAPAGNGSHPAASAAPVLVAAAPSGPAAPGFEGKSVREVLQESLARGIQVEIIGSGIARAQFPAAGSPLPPGQRIRVVFR
ncbi:MAG: transpeptidase family protein [Acidobacteria bacterium]|nr:transpeptidase family protein [Acidobacteriota bacterium]